MAVDPTYPLYPILSIVAAFFMFLILSHSLIRQSWNLAVTFLCIGLFFDDLTHGINAVVWRDNADIKVPVYCDLGITPSLLAESILIALSFPSSVPHELSPIDHFPVDHAKATHYIDPA
jgi:hypothetical protein